MDQNLRETRKQWGLYLDEYDAGSESITTDYLVADVVPAEPLINALLYVDVASVAKFNESTKEIYLPAEAWTPIIFRVTSSNVKVLEGTGTVRWQGAF